MKAKLYVFAYSEACGAVDLTFHNVEGEGPSTQHVLTLSRLEAGRLQRALEDALRESRVTGMVEHRVAFEANVEGRESSLRTTTLRDRRTGRAA